MSAHVFCPDCRGVVPVKELKRLDLAGYGTFYECPRCEVGSLAGAWRIPVEEKNFNTEVTESTERTNHGSN